MAIRLPRPVPGLHQGGLLEAHAVTEDEAKTKWCPFVRADKSDATNARAINRFQENDKQLPKGTRCIGSACMAWRWDDHIERRWTQDPPEGEGWEQVHAIGGIEHWARTSKTPGGYCGLAGQP